MLPALLAVASAASWGTADFIGGLASRTMHVLRVVVWGQLIGIVVAFVVTALIVGTGTLNASWLASGALAGVTGGLAITAFYYALSRCPMSLVAPVSASGVVIPVAVSLGRGEVPGPVALVGVAFVLVGIITVSLVPSHPGEQLTFDRRGIAASVFAAIGFAATLTILDHAAGTAQLDRALWAAAGLRLGSLSTCSLAALLTRTPVLPPAGRAGWLSVTGIGLGDTLANSLYAVAASRGNLAVVAALASLYPATTVILARVVLGERTTRWQQVGIGFAMVGIVCAAAG